MSTFTRQLKRVINLADHVDIQAAQAHIQSNVEFKGTNTWILIFAIVIASVGLNVNSIPVIIGAMLISPLMGPIMGIGLALGINDTVLLKEAFRNLLIMTGISIITSAFFFLISPLDLEAPTELLARTNPTIYDVFIALFGGLAVIVEVCKKEKGTVIAGAAIATALMPPLCTAGYGLANGNLIHFLGAFYLYFINSVFIALATFLMVRYLHFPMVKFSDPVKQKKVHRSITAFTLILIIPSIYSAVVIIQENKFNQAAKRFVAENKTLPESYIYDYAIRHRARKPSLLCISIAGKPLTANETARLQHLAESYGIRGDQLEIVQNATSHESNQQDKEVVKTIFEQNEQEIRKREEKIARLEVELNKFISKKLPSTQIAREIEAQYPQIASLTLARGETVDNGKSKEEVVALIRLSSRLSPEELEKMNKWLAVRLDVPSVRLIQELISPAQKKQ